MLPGPLQVGDLLSERYRLLDPVRAPGSAALWRAHDEVLARDVAVRVLTLTDATTHLAAQRFLEAAAHGGRVNHPGLVRVYDAVHEHRRGRDLAYVIREWVDGEPLDDHLLRVGELAPPEAVDLHRQAADALTAAHAAGLAHGRLHPRNVLVTAAGRVRVCDAAVAAALQGEPPPVADDATVARDTRDLAAVLFALLTSRWPAGATPLPGGGLPEAPPLHGHVVAAHQLRAGVPRTLDNVVSRALAPDRVPTLPPLRTPAALADAAEHAVAPLRQARLLESTPRPPGWARRHWAVLSAVGVVAAFAAGGWFAGLAVGALPRKPNAVDEIIAPQPSPSAGASEPAVALDLSRVTLRDFDPYGDKQENADQLRNAVDGDPATAWLTARYRSATFGGLKPGVGILLDLGRVRELRQVQVGFTTKGAHVELRASRSSPEDLRQLRLLAADEDGRQLATLNAPPGARARYLLVWITELPKDEEGFRVGVAELRVT